MRRLLCLGCGNGYDIPTGEQIVKIGNAGFDGFFTGWEYGSPVRMWRETADREGLYYQSIHAPFTKMNRMWEEGELGDAAEAELIACLHDCAAYGVPVMVSHAFIGFDQHEPNDTGVARFRRVAEEALKSGVRLALENTEGEEYLAALMNGLSDIPAVGFCIDTGHEMCYNRSQDMIGKYADRVIATHLNDNMGITDPKNITWLDDSHLLPFDGIGDWQGIADRLERSGYSGPLTFELTCQNKPDRHTHDHYAGWNFEEFLANAYERVQRFAGLFRTR